MFYCKDLVNAVFYACWTKHEKSIHELNSGNNQSFIRIIEKSIVDRGALPIKKE